jgi:TonB family protein
MSTAVWIAWALSLAGCEDPGVRQEEAAAVTAPEVSASHSSNAEPAAATPRQPPRVATETPNTSATGSLGKDEIQKVIRQHNPQVQGCYERELANAPRLAGDLTVRFTISPAGGVTASEVVQSHGPNAGLEQCVAAELRTWAFPKPNGGVVRTSYRFVFKQVEPPPAQARAQRAAIQL